MKGCVDWNIPLNKLDQICFKGQGVYSGTFPMRVYQFKGTVQHYVLIGIFC